MNKKNLILLGLMTLLCLPINTYAANVGGAETQEQGRWSLGAEVEYIFEREMDWDGSNLNEPGVDTTDVKIRRLYRAMTKINYALLHNLNIYTKLGASDFESEDNSIEFGMHAGRDYIKGDVAFAWGLGMKATYELRDDWFLGLDAQYLRHKNDFSGRFIELLFDGEETWSGEFTFQEWHIAPYIAKDFRLLDRGFVPYLGFKYSDLRVKVDEAIGANADGWEKYKADNIIGLFMGSGYEINDNLSVNVEVRFLNELAIGGALTYKFD